MTEVDSDKVWALCRQTKTAGSKLQVWPPTDKNSYWYQIGVELGVIEPTLPPPPPPPPPPSNWWASVLARFPTSLITPTRTVTVTTASQWSVAIQDLRAGDRVNVSGVSFSSQQTISKDLSSPAEIHFAADVRFTGSVRLLNCVWLKACRNVRLYGGNMTNPNGNGFLLHDCIDTWWHGFYVHDTAGMGYLVSSPARDSTGLSLQGEVTRWGLDWSQDPHSSAGQPGSGLHGGYIGAITSTSNKRYTQGRFALDAHDGIAGAGMEVGPCVRDSFIGVKAQNLTFNAATAPAPNGVRQVGGNPVQLYGALLNVEVQLEASNIARAVDEQLWSESNNIDVTHGRATNTRLTPVYEPHADITYTDCT